MSTHTTVRLVDDLTGMNAAETVSFALDGSRYEIDLSEENASRLRDALAVFIEKARIRQDLEARNRHRSVRAERARTAAIRAWANENGYGLAERGRLPAHVVSAYEQLHGRSAAV